MATSLFIEYGNQVVQFPVNPPELKVITGTNDDTFDVLKLGEVSEFGYSNLVEMEIECFFPADKNAPYVLTKGSFWKPQKYIDFFMKIMKERKPCRFTVSGTKINYLVTILDFDYGPVAGTDDIEYRLQLREYKEHSAKFVKVVKAKVTTAKKQTTTTKKQKGSTNKKVTVGCEVIVNGRLHRDSYGTGPGQTEKNARRYVNFIVSKPNSRQKHTIHVRLLGKDNSQRTWRGWVKPSEVKRV